MLKTKMLNTDLVFQKVKIKNGEDVADFGCGQFGYFTFPLSRLVGKNGKVYAIDLLQKNLEAISKEVKKNNIQNIETVWADLEVPEGAKIASESVNTVFLVNTLHQANKPVKMLSEAKRMLKKEGQLLIVDWKSFGSNFGPETNKRVDKDFLIKAGEDQGLFLKDEFDAGPDHYGLLFTKP
ncbi:MAG: class I SAM-dependent methyltransferase [bacterium]